MSCINDFFLSKWHVGTLVKSVHFGIIMFREISHLHERPLENSGQDLLKIWVVL